MMERSRAEGSSPLATVEEIQRRLLRPPPLLSPPPTSTITSRDDVPSRDSLQNKVNLMEFQIKKEREVAKKKLEDYLDPVLLSAISSKIKSEKENGDKKLKKRTRDFEWPVEELKVFMEKPRPKARADWRYKVTVDLNDDRDVIEDFEAEAGESCTPFERFEQTALKLFQGVKDNI
ncbi:hypothetical protein L1049_008377 [Liquidambar formosana]|uniref:Uncharacterized protein n=1 Tax=Liquidambar formosana TaxID=63359 RepID=A0AAP0S2X8_LIQFO